MIGDTGTARIATFTGRYVNPLDLAVDDIVIEDIAHALSNTCRFTGHTSRFYSVGQHSVICSRMWGGHSDANRLYRKALLLHDATEAYICDLSGPLKRDTEIGRAYKKLEQKIAAVVEQRFDLPAGIFESFPVKHVDKLLLQREGLDLMANGMDWVDQTAAASLAQIVPWVPREAELQFLWEWDLVG